MAADGATTSSDSVFYDFVRIQNTPQGRLTLWKRGKDTQTFRTIIFIDSPLVQRTKGGLYRPTSPSRRAMHAFCSQVKPTGRAFELREIPIANQTRAIKNSQRCPEWFAFASEWGHEIASAVTDQQAIAAMKVDREFFTFWPALRKQVPGLPYYSWKHIGEMKYRKWLILMRCSYLQRDPPSLGEDPYYQKAGLVDYRGYHAKHQEVLAHLKGYFKHVGAVYYNETGVIDFKKDTVYIGVRKQTGVLLLPMATIQIKTAPKVVLVEAHRWSDSQLLHFFQLRYPAGKLAYLPPIGLEGDHDMHTFIPENDSGFYGFRYFYYKKGESDSKQWLSSSPQAFLRNAILADRQGEIALSSLKRNNQTILCFSFEILDTVQKHLGISEPVKGDMVVVHGKMVQGPLTRYPESFQVGNTKNFCLPSVATHLNVCLFSTYAGGKVDNLVLAFPKNIDRRLVVPFIQFGKKVMCLIP